MAKKVLSAILTLKDKDFSSNMKKAAGGVNDFDRKLKHSTNEIKRYKDNAVSSFKGMALGVGAAIAGAFAVDKIKDFGVSLIESAAGTQAVNAQFSQVFGDIQSNAQSTVDDLGASFGMVSDRIKPAFTTMTSMFKGLGMDTEDAMTQAKSAVTLAADAAAFYDKSYEDANSALNSFIKGNYEGGEAIGLFANETQMASWASKNLGVDWKKLDEAGKQVTRLQFAKAMQEAAGATGQAARESDSYENQLGNLRQSWDNVKAKLGEPILEPAVQGLKSLSEWVGKVDTDKIINGFSSMADKAKTVIVPVFEDVKAGIGWIVKNKDPIIAATTGVVAGFAAFKIISGINTAMGIFNTLMVAYRAGTLASTLATLGFNTALLANPLTWVAVGIAAVVAGGILLYKNWDTVKAKGLELWESLKGVWSGIKEGFSGMWEGIKGGAKAGINFIIGGLNKMITGYNSWMTVKIPDWIPSEFGGGKTLGFTIPTIPQFALGTSYFTGGLAQINERGGEIVDLPNGSRIYPHDKSVQMARNESNNTFNITIHAADKSVSEIINELVPQLKIRLANM